MLAVAPSPCVNTGPCSHCEMRRFLHACLMLYCTILCFCFKMSWLHEKQVKMFSLRLEYSLQSENRLPWLLGSAFAWLWNGSPVFMSKECTSIIPLRKWWIFFGDLLFGNTVAVTSYKQKEHVNFPHCCWHFISRI